MSDLNIRMMAGSTFKAADLNAGPVVLTIKDIVSKDYEGKDKPYLTFEETNKGFIANVTNTNLLCDLFGESSVDMIGQKVELFQARTKYMGKMVPCISVRAPESEE